MHARPQDEPDDSAADRPWTKAGVAAVLAMIAVAVALVVADDDPGEQPRRPAEPAAFAINGTVMVPAERPDFDAAKTPDTWQAPADYCDVKDGYDDVPGGQVTVTDPDGTVLAVGATEYAGRDVLDCRLRFRVAGVPEGHGIYGIEVSHRGVVRFPRAALERAAMLEIG